MAELDIVIDVNKIAIRQDLEVKLLAMADVLRTEIGATDDVSNSSLNGIINTPNATINGSPASYIKALARAMKTNHRADIREIKLMLRELDVADTDTEAI